jgi:ribosome-binding factor A
MMTVNPKKEFYKYGREPVSHKRPKRVADLIKNEIAMLLLHKVKDPRLVNVAIVSAEVTRDLRKAIIYYSVLGDEEKTKKAAAGLARAKGFMRSHLAKELGMRATR